MGDLNLPGSGPVGRVSADRSAQLPRLGRVYLHELAPIDWHRNRPFGQLNGRSPSGALRQTAPRPVLGIRHQLGAGGIALDVSTDVKEESVIRHRERFVPTLVDVTRAASPSEGVPPLAVSPG